VSKDEHAERFTLLRPLLFTIVYEILAPHPNPTNVLQDSYLRWADVDLATVRDTKSYLAQLVTRQALNALRRAPVVGRTTSPWLPEPLLLDGRDASADVVLAESVSIAMLVLLETLTLTSGRCSCCARCSPSITTKSQGRSANRGGRCGRWRTGPESTCKPAQTVRARRRDQDREITEQFMTAAATGDMDGLLSMLAPNATWTADSNGKASAARRPVGCAAKVAAALVGLFRRASQLPDVRVETVTATARPRSSSTAAIIWRASSPSRSSTARSPTSTPCATRQAGHDLGPRTISR